MKYMKANYFFILFAILCLIFKPFNSRITAATIPAINNLSRNNDIVQKLRKDIRTSLYIIKSNRSVEELPELTIYKYTVKNDESFWDIVSVTNLDLDTIVSVNSLSAPSDVKKGLTLYIPNMRGIVYEKSVNESYNSIATNYNIPVQYILKVNRISNNEHKQYIFIPCGNLSDLDRSLFLGTAFVSPLTVGKLSSYFGVRKDPIDHIHKFHAGVDIACPMNSPVYASRDGVVVFCGFKGGYGNLIIIKHSRDYFTLYGHLNKMFVGKGQIVTTGQLIAKSGNTGRTTGPHLHFEIRKNSNPVNPLLLLR
ncbi:MAG: LysM peptidoglycan-binding domain-containing M23 family metallopeptidase [Spirochaetes bacterium]|nr:LysM peptidoglycan-binding domain-containing M23 family metallopeptidase [Spirochaetota bacterium]